MWFKNIVKKILNSKLFISLGISLINYDLLKYLRHYSWLLSFRKIPTLTISFNSVRRVTEEDIEICRRLVVSYRKACAGIDKAEKNTSILWSEGLKKHCGLLISKLESGYEKALAEILSRMFREDFVYGLASGSLINNARSCLGRKIWSMKYQDNIVSLGEYLGVTRAESPEQGLKGYALKDGLGRLIEKIEVEIGKSVGFPDIGAPYGIKIKDTLLTMEHPEHLYVALRLSRAVNCLLKDKINKPLNLVEIGAGYGGLAYCIKKLGIININSYTIVDLPLINVLQGYFLMKAFGSSAVNLFGESVSKNTVLSIIPNLVYEKEIKNQVDVLINENSMPEMSDDIVKNYMEFAKRQVSGLFFSYNHEAYSVVYGKPQVLVPGIINRVGGFVRLSRNPSWVRNGYVEEIYGRDQSPLIQGKG
jgi:hypothetical protein